MSFSGTGSGTKDGTIDEPCGRNPVTKTVSGVANRCLAVSRSMVGWN